MKRFMALTQIIFLVTISLSPVFAQPTQGRRVGNIKGLVIAKKKQDENKKEEDKPKDLGTWLQTTIISDLPMDKLYVEIPDNPLFKGSIPKITAPIVSDGWTAKQDEKGISFNGPASFSLIIRIDLPPNTDQLVEQLIKNGLSFNPSFDIYGYGTHQAEVKRGETKPPVKPDEAAYFPEYVQIGHYFFFTPKEGFTDGKWTVKIGDKVIEETKYYPIKEIDTSKLNQLPADSKSPEKVVITAQRIKEEIEEFNRLYKEFNKLGKKIPSDSFEIIDPPTFLIIPKDTPRHVKIGFTYTNEFGERTVEGDTNIKVLPDNSKETALLPPRLIKCTPKLFQGDTVCVCGFFPSVSSANFYQSSLLLDGKPLGIPLSSSTEIATFLPENLAPGKHIITWDIKDITALRPLIREDERPLPSPQEKVEFVVLEVKPEIIKKTIEIGEVTEMWITIIGTEENIPIRLTNKTPTIIRLVGGDAQVATTSGGSPNMLKRVITGNVEGEFDIEYVLDLPPCPCNPEQADAEKSATGTVPKTTETTTTKPIENPPPTEPTETTADKDCKEIEAVFQEQLSRLRELQLARFKELKKCDKADLSFLPADVQDKLRKECRESIDNFHTPKMEEQEFILAGIVLRYFLCKDKKK